MSCHRKTSLVLWAGIFLRALLFHRRKFLRLRHSLVQYRTTVPADHIFQPVAQESIPPKGHGGRILLPADPQVIQATPGAMGDGNLRLFYSQCAVLQDSRLARRPRMPQPPDRSGRKGSLPARCSSAALPGKSSIGSRCPMTWDARCRAAGAAFPPAGRKRKTRPDRESRSGRGTWRRRGFTAAAGGSGRRAGRRRAPPPWGSGRTRPRSGTGRRRP